MGQSEIKREHLRLSEEDFPILEKETKDLMSLILSLYKCEIIQQEVWPYRYGVEKNNIQYEFIFSQMGSVTLRIAKSDRYRRNPPPIFYISIGKYPNGEYVWEDFNASPVSILKEDIFASIESSMQMYESSIQNFQ
ncbi:MAG: hypothetical protein IPL26_21795 [Leptospiraceae bacterium]|nr:hypothetical protein [Leptospiraceae bacterium]